MPFFARLVSHGAAMPDNTVTLVLNGEVPLTEFARTIPHFNQLVRALSAEAGNPNLDWVIQDLSVSSALASVMSLGEEKIVQSVVSGFADVGTALEAGTPINHSEAVQAAARNVISISDSRISSVNFGTAKREATVLLIPDSSTAQIGTTPKLTVSHYAPAFGAVEGRIQTLTNRGSLRFSLYDL